MSILYKITPSSPDKSKFLAQMSRKLCANKDLRKIMGSIFLRCPSVGKHRHSPKHYSFLHFILGDPIELDGKILLLKKQHTWVTELGKVNLVSTWMLHFCWLSFIILVWEPTDLTLFYPDLRSESPNLFLILKPDNWILVWLLDVLILNVRSLDICYKVWLLDVLVLKVR